VETAPKVFGAICAVMADLGKEGITKDRKNEQQGFKFRGVDDVYNALSPLLAKHRLAMLPRFTERSVVEHQSNNGKALYFVTVKGSFLLASADDGSTVEISTFGEAQDSADKATNKAMSAAYKYAAFQAFAIPTEGDNDADAYTPPPSTRVAPKQPPPQAAPTKDTMMDDIGALWAAKSPAELAALVTRWKQENRYPAGSPERDTILKAYEEAKAQLAARAA
jgi:hypothetical protein